jgi:fluoroacetyl-CoA thioesterase
MTGWPAPPGPVAVEPDPPREQVHGGLAPFLVLADLAAGDEGDDRLSQHVLVTAVDGVGAAPVGACFASLSSSRARAVKDDFSVSHARTRRPLRRHHWPLPPATVPGSPRSQGAQVALPRHPPYGGDVRYEVTGADTADAVGSGDVPVLATPRLIAWMEAETMTVAAESVAPDQTTVGTAVRVHHVRPTRVGGAVDVEARLVSAPGDRRLTFDVFATNAVGQVVGHGQIDRAVVGRAEFLGSAGAE